MILIGLVLSWPGGTCELWVGVLLLERAQGSFWRLRLRSWCRGSWSTFPLSKLQSSTGSDLGMRTIFSSREVGGLDWAQRIWRELPLKTCLRDKMKELVDGSNWVRERIIPRLLAQILGWMVDITYSDLGKFRGKEYFSPSHSRISMKTAKGTAMYLSTHLKKNVSQDLLAKL